MTDQRRHTLGEEVDALTERGHDAQDLLAEAYLLSLQHQLPVLHSADRLEAEAAEIEAEAMALARKELGLTPEPKTDYKQLRDWSVLVDAGFMMFLIIAAILMVVLF